MNIIFTCGGTAGHVNPAIAIAESIQKKVPGCRFLFIGAEGQMEQELVRREGYDFTSVNITNISRGRSLNDITHNIDTIKNAAIATVKAREIIKRFQPDAVIGTGGYVCFPVITAAHELRIPTFVHESNAVPGLTTKLLAPSADRIFVGFDESKKYYRGSEKIITTGTPVRHSFSSCKKEKAKENLGIAQNVPVVLSVWGSLGSEYMNQTIREMVPQVQPGRMKMYHSTGKRYFADFDFIMNSGYRVIENGELVIKDYLYDIPELMTAADLVICRAGASTISELTYLGRPALIVPSPNVTNNHQEKNARVLEKAGAAKVFLEGSFTSADFYRTICDLLDDPCTLDTMAANMGRLGNRDSSQMIADIILSDI